MAQTSRTQKANNYPSNAGIPGLRSQMAVGATIDAVDINTLINLINAWIGHTHTYDDAYQLATYGVAYGDNPGAGDRTDYYEDKTTGNSGLPGIGQVGAGSIITAAKHNEMKDRCNQLRGHVHGISDRSTA